MTKTYVERTLETLVEFADVHRQSLTAQRESIDSLTHQVGLFTEGLTRLEILIERQESKIERILEAIQQQTVAIDGHLRLAEAQAETAKAQAETAKAQASNIAALTRLVEVLVGRN